MKKVSRINLKKKIGNGWEVDSIEKPKPKKPKKPLMRDAVIEIIERSSSETNKAISAMADSIGSFINAQSKERAVTVDIPNPKQSKKVWKFEVSRDRDGFIKDVTAKEI